ncbi:MAG: hypothetical protein K5787_16920 [Lentisphaeria bacterium]|nr:hypothetical protein [Lentisphaeria bacterium]
MTNGEAEVVVSKSSASVFLRLLRGIWCVIRFIFCLMFGRVGLAIVFLLLLTDYLLESQGISGKVLDRFLHPQDGMRVQCKSIHLGVFKGIELHNVEIDMDTKAGPLAVHARLASARMNWLKIFNKQGWIPKSAKVLSVTLDLKKSGQGDESLLSCNVREGALEFTDDDKLQLNVKGDSLGIKLEVDGVFTNARKFLAEYKGDDGPVKPDPELLAQLEKISDIIHGFKRLNDDSSINISFGLDYRGELYLESINSHFNLSNWLVNGVLISKCQGHCIGNMQEISFDDMDIVLNHSETISGNGKIYLKNENEAENNKTKDDENKITPEFEVKQIKGFVTPATICRLAGVDTKDWLTHRVRIPALSFVGELPKCEMDISKMEPKMIIELSSSFECFGMDIESGGFNLTYKDKIVSLDHISFVLSNERKEQLNNGRISLDLNKMQVDGNIHANLVWGERLKKYDVRLPETILEDGNTPADIDIILEPSPFDWRKMKLTVKLEDHDLHFMTQNCQLEGAFELDKGKAVVKVTLNSSPQDWHAMKLDNLLESNNFGFLRQIYRRLESENVTGDSMGNSGSRGWENSINLNVSCDVADGLDKKVFETKFTNSILVHTDMKSEQKLGLFSEGNVLYKLDKQLISLPSCSGICHPDWLYESYCKRLNLSISDVFELLGTSDKPVEFKLHVPENSLSDIDKCEMFASVKGYDSHFGMFKAKEIGCDVKVNSTEVNINNITAITQEEEHLRLDIRVQYSPVEFSIKDLELEGNPGLAEAFILDSEANSIYKKIWSDVKWNKEKKPKVRMPSLIFKDGSPWSLSLTANIDALTQDNDRINLDLDVLFSPFEFSLRNLELKGNPAVAEAFIPNMKAKTVYHEIWSKVKWDDKKKPIIRMPSLIYKDGSPWSLMLTAHINAQNVSYNDYKVDELNLIVSLDLPSSLSVKPIILKTPGGDVYGEIGVTFDGVPHCTFKIDGDEGYLNPKKLLTTVKPEFNTQLADITFDDKSHLSLEGEMFLTGDPRISVKGSLNCPKLTWSEKKIANEDYELYGIDSTWSYSADSIAWKVTKSTFLDGNLRTSGVYELDNNRGEFLVLVDDMSFAKTYKMFLKKKKDEEDMKKEEKVKPGRIFGECHGHFLLGWGGRPINIEGDGHVALREADMWKDIPLLAQLGEMLPGGKKSKAALGNITQLDADVEFHGNRLIVPQLYTDGTIMALRGKGEVGLESNKFKFQISGVPLQEVNILSMALSPLTWAFQAEVDETMKWRIKFGLTQLFSGPER